MLSCGSLFLLGSRYGRYRSYAVPFPDVYQLDPLRGPSGFTYVLDTHSDSESGLGDYHKVVRRRHILYGNNLASFISDVHCGHSLARPVGEPVILGIRPLAEAVLAYDQHCVLCGVLCGRVIGDDSDNLVTFVDPFSDNATQELETVISEEQAAAFTIGFTLGEWAATAEEEVEQVELRCDDGEWSGAPEGTAFLIKKDGVLSIAAELPEWKGEEGLIVRAANSRGGFGAPAVYISHEGIDQITNDQLPMTNKVFINGILYIERNNHLYDATGRMVK